MWHFCHPASPFCLAGLALVELGTRQAERFSQLHSRSLSTASPPQSSPWSQQTPFTASSPVPSRRSRRHFTARSELGSKETFGLERTSGGQPESRTNRPKHHRPLLGGTDRWGGPQHRAMVVVRVLTQHLPAPVLRWWQWKHFEFWKLQQDSIRLGSRESGVIYVFCWLARGFWYQVGLFVTVDVKSPRFMFLLVIV